MKKILSIGLLAGAMTFGAQSAVVAADNIVASNPDAIKAFFVDQGIPATLEEDSVGDPLLKLRYFGTTFSMYFFGCSDNTNCKSVQYFSGYKQSDAVPVSQINEWNVNNRFLRAYGTETGAARIEYDIYLGEDGMTVSDFNNAFSKWTRGLTEFEKYIDFN